METTVLSFHCLSFLASHSYASPKPFFSLTFMYHSGVNLFSGIGPWLTTCLHCSIHCPPSSTNPPETLYFSSFSYKALRFLCLYLPTWLRKRMLETDCAFISVTETCLTQFQKRTSTSPSFGASQSFHLLRGSFSKSILPTCLFKINSVYYSFSNCVSLSLSPS